MDLFGKFLHSILKSNMILGVQEFIIDTRTVIKKWPTFYNITIGSSVFLGITVIYVYIIVSGILSGKRRQ